MKNKIMFKTSFLKTQPKENSIVFEKESANEIFLDFQRVSTGWIQFSYKVTTPTQLKFTYGPVRDCMKFEFVISLSPDAKLYRRETYIACRYLKIERAESNQSAAECFIHNFNFMPSQYSAFVQGDFHCEDENINSVFSMGAYTDALCAQKNDQAFIAHENNLSKESLDFRNNWVGTSGHNYVFFDGPRRDRETWLGDLRTEALTAYTALGWNDVVQNTLELFHALQTNEGYTFGSGTSCQKFLEYNLWWVISVWEYYLYTGNIAYLEQWYPSMLRLWEYVFRLQNGEGFIRGDACWMWTFPREGYSSALQCILYQALCKAGEISNVMRDYPRAKNFNKIAMSLRENINEYFWNEEKGIYNEVIGFRNITPPVFQDVNSYAVVFDIANDKQKTRILDYLKKNMWTAYGSTTTDVEIRGASLKENLKSYALKRIVEGAEDSQAMLQSVIYAHNKQVWPFMNGYEVQARFLAGDEEGAVQLIKNCWGNKAYKETGTFWEMYDVKTNRFAARKISEFDSGDSYNSACHGWSGWVSYLIQTYLLGVQPVAAGYKETVVRPQPASLTQLSGRVPTPYGEISVSMQYNNGKWYIEIEHPDVIEVKLITDSPAFEGKEIELKVLKKI